VQQVHLPSHPLTATWSLSASAWLGLRAGKPIDNSLIYKTLNNEVAERDRQA